MTTRNDPRPALGLRPVINVSGTMTSLGASIVVPEARAAVAGILPEFVEIANLHRRASRVIAEATGGEAGFVTASCAAGITLAVAAAMTGSDLAAIERLPDAAGLRNEVVMLAGHMVDYGAPVEQGVRLAGAKVVPVGQATSSRIHQLAGVITERTAAALFVVSHHVASYGMVPFSLFVEAAHARGVPVIVDAASEYDLTGFLAAGADVAIYSAHKFLGGPTAGIVAGRKDLVRATYLQNRGIGRGMKVGKESILGTMAALEAWARRDHAAVRRRERAALDHWVGAFEGRPGVRAEIVPDPTDNPLDRLQLFVDPAVARITAWDLADSLAAGAPPVIVRDHEVEHGYFFLDPCNLHEGEEFVVGRRIAEELEAALGSNGRITDFAERTRRRDAAILDWPD
ncbi:aminotransferase class V-fold PLP-dependent enzyme [Prosthecomicrobium sp. N25]|uniref:aminotransferase class V-fold PLP-dependent enzyme n=1 Tax=Prosthecomicrobium sp. N25 TaxID=3129254 RepID=UPI003077D382